MRYAPQQKLGLAIDVLRGARDIVDERVDELGVPGWCRARDWESFLGSLGEAEVRHAETHGLAAVLDGRPDAPADLRSLAGAVREATDLDPPGREPPGALRGSIRRVASNKRKQLESMLRLCEPLVRRAGRVVDVGSGHGHLARWVAEVFGATAIGLERVQARVQTAERLVPAGARVQYRMADVLREPWELDARDLAVGLHACGELGDATTEAVARARCDMVLVACCFQKIRAEVREPLSAPMRHAGIRLRREVLGLGNLTSRERCVAGSAEDMMLARRNRLALRLLLRERGLAIEPGQEMHRLNRRRAYAELEPLAVAALRARGHERPTPPELERVAREAAASFERVRRWSLPRNMLGRLLEVTIALDRASFLVEHGLDAWVTTAFPASASPRNVAVVAG